MPAEGWTTAEWALFSIGAVAAPLLLWGAWREVARRIEHHRIERLIRHAKRRRAEIATGSLGAGVPTEDGWA